MLQGYVEAGEPNVPHNGLAERRMRAVRRALISAGVDSSRIEETRVAGTEPVCADRSEQCRELNRRVEIAVVDPRAAILSLATIDPERFKRGASAP